MEAKNNDKSLSTNSMGVRCVIAQREQGQKSMTSGGTVLQKGTMQA